MSEQTANLCTTDACESLRARLAKYEDAEGNPVSKIEEQAREIAALRKIISECATACGAAVSVECSLEFMAMLPKEIALKAQPSGVVLPERWSVPRPIWKDARQPYGDPLNKSDIEAAGKFNLALDEVARLNSSPVSAGDPCMCGGNPHTTQCLYEHFLSYSGLADQPTLRYAYFHGADTQCEQPCAGVVDERAAFETWYLGHFYMGDKQCGLEWLSTEPCGGYRHQHPAEQWIVWQARAALSANHSEQVRECEDWSVFFGYLIDKYEGHEIAEERLQGWLAEMLADPHYGALFRREKVNGGQPSPIALAIEAAEEEHGGLRAAAKALGIDAGYLSRLKSGEKLNPGDDVLAALGLERVTMYRAAAPSAGSHKEQG